MNKPFHSRLANMMRYIGSGRAATAGLAVLLSLCLTVASSLAWFSTNRDLTSEDMDMGLSIDDTSAVYKAYMYDLDEMKGIDTIKGENGEDEALNIANLKMNEYDTIFVVQNKYTPAFAQIQISRNSYMPKSGTVSITIYRNSATPPFDGNGKLSACVSSALRFTALIDKTKGDLNMTNANDLYDHINSETWFKEVEGYRGERTHSNTFVSAHGEGDGHTHEKADAITVSLSYTEADWYEPEPGVHKLNVYLYMSYDAQLIDCFLKEHASDKIVLDGTTYEFENDLKSVSISYTPSN